MGSLGGYKHAAEDGVEQDWKSGDEISATELQTKPGELP